MNWKALNRNHCPRCNFNLSWELNQLGFECKRCKFFITQKRMTELSASLSADNGLKAVGDSSDNDDLF